MDEVEEEIRQLVCEVVLDRCRHRAKEEGELRCVEHCQKFSRFIASGSSELAANTNLLL